MDCSRAQVGVDAFDTYAPVIDYSTVWFLISLAFGNHWEMFHWDISVAFTSAKAEEKTYVRFPKSFPDDLFPRKYMSDFLNCFLTTYFMDIKLALLHD